MQLAWLWPCLTSTTSYSSPGDDSHTQTVLSLEHVASRLPSGCQATSLTSLSCPSRQAASCHCCPPSCPRHGGVEAALIAQRPSAVPTDAMSCTRPVTPTSEAEVMGPPPRKHPSTPSGHQAQGPHRVFPDGDGAVKARCGQVGPVRGPAAGPDGAGVHVLQDGAAVPGAGLGRQGPPDADRLVPAAAREHVACAMGVG